MDLPTPPTTNTQCSASPPTAGYSDSDHEAEERGRPRVRKRRRLVEEKTLTATMEDEPASKRRHIIPVTAVASRLDTASVPILTARDSSAQRTESASPSRSPSRRDKKTLATTVPKISIDEGVRRDDPNEVWELGRSIQEAARQANPPEEWDFPTDLGDRGTIEHEEVRHILHEAHLRKLDSWDESGWIDVVRLVLRHILSPGRRDARSDIGWNPITIQTQSINETWLPTVYGTKCFSKKCDIAISYGRNSADLKSLRDSALEARVHLSHMDDTFSSTVPVALPIEVKADYGNKEEAEVQVAVALTAALAFQHSQQGVRTPLLGFTVVGHDWRIYMSWWEGDNEVTVRNIGGHCSGMGTLGVVEIAKLIAVLQVVVARIKDEQWPAQGTLLREMFAAS